LHIAVFVTGVTRIPPRRVLGSAPLQPEMLQSRNRGAAMNANPILSHATRHNESRRARPARHAIVDMAIGASLAVVRWWRIRQDEHLLLSQPDHLLRDIGIARQDIRAVLRSGMSR
jgi:uncharacterized protein YjiS (DUF1127 family)